jgi:hypothetical protein
MNMLEKILGAAKRVGGFVDRQAQLANERDAQINEQIRLSIMESDPELYRMLYVPQITGEERRKAEEELYNSVGWKTDPDYLVPQKPSVENIMRQLEGYYDYAPQGSNKGYGFGA